LTPSPAWGSDKPLGVNPDFARHETISGPIPHIAGASETPAVTDNWAGLVDTGTTFTGVSSNWTVPSVQASATGAVSSTWIGVDGWSDSTVIQTGTAQNTAGGATTYFAWYELYPSASVEIGGVNPGDHMYADIYQQTGTPGTWTIYIEDLTLNVQATYQVSYSGNLSSAEWIEEMQTVTPGPQPPLANFGTATFTQPQVQVASPNFTSTPVLMEDVNNDLLAYPSFPANGDVTVNYGRFPSQTAPSASPASVTTGSQVTYSATLSSAFGTPTVGTIAFYVGSTPLCTANVSSGAGSCTSSVAPAGTDTISATYGGDNLFAPSIGTTVLTVNNPPPPPPPQHGYWLVGSDGGIFTFGSAQFFGSTGSIVLQRPVVGIVPTTDHGGYWLDASDGGVFSYGDTQFYGSIPGLGIHPFGSGLPVSLGAPIVGMVPSADDGGYFMVGSDGGVFAFGDARFAGSCPGIGGCSGAAVAVMPDATGNGYWVVTKTGSVYAFGDAPNYGAPGPQSVPVTSAVRTPDGRGYWILFANGAVWRAGDAEFFGDPVGQMGGLDPATAIFATAEGNGYWVAAANGAVAAYGDAPNDGSMLGTHLNGSIIAATGW
jgi:hypothetical protein